MKKIYTIFSLIQFMFLANSILAQHATIPITAVSFPYSVIDKNGGAIDFYAKLTGFSGSIPVGDCNPHFFIQSDEWNGTFYPSLWYMGFNSNNGAGNGGLEALGGRAEAFYRDYNCGTGVFGNWTYEEVLGTGQVDKWHHYRIVWDKDGATDHDPLKRMSIYVDDVLNTQFWNENILRDSVSDVSGGVLNLISTGPGGCGTLSGMVAIDEFKVYDRAGNLVLYNSLGSETEVTHSVTGPNGSFNGGGNAHFITGIVGNAVEANPVSGFGVLNTCTPPINLNVANATGTSARLQWTKPDSNAYGFEIAYRDVNSNKWIRKIRLGIADHITLIELSPNTTYKWAMRTLCGYTLKSGWTAGPDFTTTNSFASANETLGAILNGKEKISISPNPVTANMLTVHISNAIANNYQLSITDMQGRMLINQNLLLNGSSDKTINVSALSGGTYILKIINNKNEQQQIKFVKAN